MIICVETMIAVCWDHRQHGGKRVSDESTLFTFLAVSHIESLICLHKDIMLKYDQLVYLVLRNVGSIFDHVVMGQYWKVNGGGNLVITGDRHAV